MCVCIYVTSGWGVRVALLTMSDGVGEVSLVRGLKRGFYAT